MIEKLKAWLDDLHERDSDSFCRVVILGSVGVLCLLCFIGYLIGGPRGAETVSFLCFSALFYAGYKSEKKKSHGICYALLMFSAMFALFAIGTFFKWRWVLLLIAAFLGGDY